MTLHTIPKTRKVRLSSRYLSDGFVLEAVL